MDTFIYDKVTNMIHDLVLAIIMTIMMAIGFTLDITISVNNCVMTGEKFVERSK